MTRSERKNLPASKPEIQACMEKGRCFLGKNKISTHVRAGASAEA